MMEQQKSQLQRSLVNLQRREDQDLNLYLTNYGQNTYFRTFWNFMDFHLGYRLAANILKNFLKIEFLFKKYKLSKNRKFSINNS
jgi:hypothetical protein